jgi:hypothetical protein
MVSRRALIVLTSLLTVALGCSKDAQQSDQPSVEQFKQVLNAHLQALRIEGFTERTVLFQDVQPGKPNGGYYPFVVTAIVRDYGPGYPPNHYYGTTCVGKMDQWKFDMLRDDTGKWIVQGRMTVSDSVCKNNPSEGVSATPASSLPGAPASSEPLAGAQPATKSTGSAGNLYLGEYACYGTGGRMMAGMGFHLKTGGKYDDPDRGRAGTYDYDAGESTISFHGGFLDGQTGSHVTNRGFQLSSTVNCEPWR